jgi:hypothetical protein
MTPARTQIAPVKLTIALIFYNIMTYYKRTYCWPTRATMQRMIHRKTGKWYTLSWIDECLHWLNHNHYLVSYFRPGRREDGTCFNRPSNRQLTRKFLVLMRKMGMKTAHYLWGASKKLDPPKDTTPLTQQSPPDPQVQIPTKPGKSPFEDPEFRKRRGWKPLPPWKIPKT